MKEYKFLKIARNIFKVLAWVVLALGIIVGIIIFVTGTNAIIPASPEGPTPTPRAAGVVFMIMGALYFLILYTISEIIAILLDIKGSCANPAA